MRTDQLICIPILSNTAKYPTKRPCMHILMEKYTRRCSLYSTSKKLKVRIVSAILEDSDSSVYSTSKIISPSLINTSQLIGTITIHTIVSFPIDSDAWIIHTFCLIGTKFSRIFVRIIRASLYCIPSRETLTSKTLENIMQHKSIFKILNTL